MKDTNMKDKEDMEVHWLNIQEDMEVHWLNIIEIQQEHQLHWPEDTE